MPKGAEPNKEEITRRAMELADSLYDELPSYPSLVNRLETLMEIFWYKGYQDAQ